tara:strand:- start:1875 stop:2846 length:972 start_codon:yes stop_codon:yes gene_type:complete
MDLYGYSNALSQGSAFNARTKNLNDGILLANQKKQDKFDAEVKQQKNTIADDSLKEKEDAAKATFLDGKTALGALAGTVEMTSGIKNAGLAGYMVDSTKGRLQTIGSTARSIVKGEPPPKPVPRVQPTEVGADGRVVGEGESVTNDLEQGGKVAGEASEAAGDTIESSGLGSKLIKGGLKLVGGAKLGEAGLTAVSEIGGKALGDFGGVVSIGKGFENLADGKNFFSGETQADKLQEIGAAADVVGTIFPPLEVVGGVLSAIGGVEEAYNDIKADMDKKDDDSTAPTPPKLTATKVTPAFSSLGLVASAPISAKASITGSSTF